MCLVVLKQRQTRIAGETLFKLKWSYCLWHIQIDMFLADMSLWSMQKSELVPFPRETTGETEGEFWESDETKCAEQALIDAGSHLPWNPPWPDFQAQNAQDVLAFGARQELKTLSKSKVHWKFIFLLKHLNVPHLQIAKKKKCLVLHLKLSCSS